MKKLVYRILKILPPGAILATFAPSLRALRFHLATETQSLRDFFAIAPFRLACFVLGVLPVLFASHPVAQTVYYPSSHWVYDFLDRMETKGVLPVLLAGTKPMTRSEIAQHLATISQFYQQGGKLSRAEVEQLEFLHGEFREELERLQAKTADRTSELSRIIRHRWIDPWLPNLIYANGRNFFSIASGPLRAHWDPIFLRQRAYAKADTLDSQERVFTDANGFVLWGTLGDHLGFITDVRDTKEWGTRLYPFGINYSAEGWGFAQGSGNHTYHDETVASAVYQWKYLTLQFGKDSNRWGPGHYGQLGLADHATSYDLAKLQVTSARFKFTSMVGWLQHYGENFFYGNHQEKALAAHRLEFAPIKQLDIGLYETIIYAGRRLEPAYLNPVMFYRAADHYLGERDNAAMGLDWELKVIPKTKLYGELFIDDLTTGKLGTGFYGNKYAYLLGVFRADLFGLANLDACLEYARIRPYVYTHDRNISYQHYTTGIGHWSGPNSDVVFLEARYQYSRRLRVSASWESRRHGANPPGKNVGGDIGLPYSFPHDPEYVEFLAGIREQIHPFSLSAEYELIRNGFVHLYYSYNRGETAGVDYPGKRSELGVFLSLNY